MSKIEKELIERIRRIDHKIAAVSDNDKLKNYNRDKVHQKQLAFHQCLKRNRWVFGGNRSGKTECGAVETVWLARGNHPYRQNRADSVGWVVSVTREVQRDVAQKKLLEYINPAWIESVSMATGKSADPSGGAIDYMRIKNVFGGISTIVFKSCEMGRAKFQGASLDYVWFDEEPPEDIYQECLMRVLDKRGEIFGTMTPLLGRTFCYNQIYLNEGGDENVWYEFMEWADNPYLDKDEVERVTATLSNDQLESRRYGRFRDNCGLVYPEFDENIHVVDPFEIPALWQDKLSIDPGLNNPLSCHWYAVSPDGIVYVTDEHYERGKDVGYHSEVIKAKCAAHKWKKDGFGRIYSLIDSAAGQKTLAGVKSVSELFSENGIQVNPKVNKDVFCGINRVKSYLKGEFGSPKIYIFRTCRNLIRELKSYYWGEGENPVKKDDHALDELRYYLMSRPEPREEKSMPGELGEFKRKLIRRRCVGRDRGQTNKKD